MPIIRNSVTNVKPPVTNASRRGERKTKRPRISAIRGLPHLRLRRYNPYFTVISFGFDSSAFGMESVRTPASYEASIFSLGIEVGSVNDRWNVP